MDLLARKKEREKQKHHEKIREIVQEEFKKPPKAYIPTSKKLTVAMIILLAILAGYMLLDSELIMKNECGIMPGLDCSNLHFTEDSISFDVTNNLKDDLNITIVVQNCEEEISKVIRPNTKDNYRFTCTVTERIISRQIFTKYVGYSELPHRATGHMQGKLNGGSK